MSCHILLFLFALLPLASALECYSGWVTSSGESLPAYYVHHNQTVCAPGTEYCITATEETPEFGRVISRFCEPRVITQDRCTEEGCKDVTVSGVAQVHVCCCKGDYCNKPDNN